MEVPGNEVQNLTRFAEEAQKELFMKMAKWSVEEQVAAGASVYSNFTPIAKPLGIDFKLDLTEDVLIKHLPKMLEIGIHPAWERFFAPVQLYDPIEVSI